MIGRPASLLSLLVFLCPLSLWANNVNFQTAGGQITSNGSTLTVNSTNLIFISGLNGANVTAGNLGTVSFSTGALLSGTLARGGTFAAGGSFSMVGNGSNGLPHGVIFNGQFNGPVTWTATFAPGVNAGRGGWFYSLSGSISGTLSTGQKLSGKVQFSTHDVSRGDEFSNVGNIDKGAGAVTVPEPGTLGLLASGLFGVAIVVRRRMSH
jgi:hypothetical protein